MNRVPYPLTAEEEVLAKKCEEILRLWILNPAIYIVLLPNDAKWKGSHHPVNRKFDEEPFNLLAKKLNQTLHLVELPKPIQWKEDDFVEWGFRVLTAVVKRLYSQMWQVNDYSGMFSRGSGLYIPEIYELVGQSRGQQNRLNRLFELSSSPFSRHYNDVSRDYHINRERMKGLPVNVDWFSPITDNDYTSYSLKRLIHRAAIDWVRSDRYWLDDGFDFRSVRKTSKGLIHKSDMKYLGFFGGADTDFPATLIRNRWKTAYTYFWDNVQAPKPDVVWSGLWYLLYQKKLKLPNIAVREQLLSVT